MSSPYFFVDSLHPAHHGKSNGVTCFSPCALCLGQPRSPNRNQQPSSPIPGEESALALFGYLPSAQNLIYGSSNCNTTSSKRTAQSDSLPACLLPNNRLRSLNRPPGWTTRTDGGTVGGTVGRPTDRPTDNSSHFLRPPARPNERTNSRTLGRSGGRFVHPRPSFRNVRPPVSPALRRE